MYEGIALAAFAGGTLVLLHRWRAAVAVHRARQRLQVEEGPVRAAALEPRTLARRTFPPRFAWLAWICGLGLGGTLLVASPLSLKFCVTFGLLLGVAAAQAEAFWADHMRSRVERQLVDALDLVIASLGAGSSVMAALENATREAQPPLRPYFEEIVGRVRYGDDPKQVFLQLAQQIPQETFLLFAATLAVHWEVGGSLGPTLANLGRVIRDRIEIARRIQANSVQSQASVAAVLFLTYFLALTTWRNNPEGMASFLGSEIGQWLIIGTLLLQAFGIVWMESLSRLRY